MVKSVNSTLEEDSKSTGRDIITYVFVTVISVTLMLSIAIVFIVRSCWRRRRGSKEYRRVPTTDTKECSQLRNEPSQVRRKVRIDLPDPPPPKTSITLATDVSKGTSKLPYCLAAATGNPRSGVEKNPPVTVGVAAPQAFLCLKLCTSADRLVVEVQNVVGLPCRADGSPVEPFVRLDVVSREKKHVYRKSSNTHPVRIDQEFTQTVYCGPLFKEEIEHSILRIEVLDHWSFSQHHVLAAADFTLDQVKDEPTKCFKVPLNIMRSGGRRALTFNSHALISLYYDAAASKLSVTIPKVELSLDTPLLLTDYWIKVVITKGEKCLVKEKVKHISLVSDEIHFTKSVVCNVSDITSLSVQCSLITMTTVNFMRRYKVMGTVTLGSNIQGQALRHWNDMLNSPNTPIAEWHDLT